MILTVNELFEKFKNYCNGYLGTGHCLDHQVHRDNLHDAFIKYLRACRKTSDFKLFLNSKISFEPYIIDEILFRYFKQFLQNTINHIGFQIADALKEKIMNEHLKKTSKQYWDLDLSDLYLRLNMLKQEKSDLDSLLTNIIQNELDS